MATPQYTVRAVGSGGQLDINVLSPDDNVGYAFGTDSDAVFYLRSTTLSADEELTGVIVGTSDHQATAANSLIISNITDDGDIQMLVNDGGNSLEFLLANGDTADLQLGHGMATATVKTASGVLTLAPAGNIVASSAVDIQGGYADGGGAPYDGVVDAAGGGNWTTLQDGDDALDAATNTVMLVKAGSYSTLTVSTNNVKIVCEPGTIVTGAIVLSGDNITLTLGAGCDIQTILTISGDNCSLLCENGVDLEGISVTGDYANVDGGSWDTISYVASASAAITVSALAATVQNITAHTPTASSWAAISLAGDFHRLLNCKVIYGGEDGIDINAGSTDNVVANCVVLDCDAIGLMVNAPRNRIIGNYILSAATIGIAVTDAGDNSVVMGNIVQDSGGDPIDINATGEDCVVTGNRTDGAVDDNSGTSTVTANEETAF